MKRRTFLSGLSVCAALVTGLIVRLPVAGRYTRAVLPRSYPGPVEPVKLREVLRPGKWAG